MASPKLTTPEIVDATKVLYNTLKLLTDSDALAAIVLTYDSYEPVRNLFGAHQCKPYEPTGISLDPRMENAFVLDGMLILRGTNLQ